MDLAAGSLTGATTPGPPDRPHAPRSGWPDSVLLGILALAAFGVVLAGVRSDLFDLDRAELIEAKGSAGRDYVRTALGQVLDYGRYVDHKRLAVMLPEHPGGDMVDLLLSYRIGCIYETSKGKFEQVERPTEE